jgi:hypothetical protein
MTDFPASPETEAAIAAAKTALHGVVRYLHFDDDKHQARALSSTDSIVDRLVNYLSHAQTPAVMEAALRDIISWKEDVLGDRSKPRGPYDCAPEITEAFDRGARMAFYRCALRASEALSDTSTDREGK